MHTFLGCTIVFFVLLCISLLATIVLFYVYSGQRKHSPIRFCCATLLSIQCVILCSTLFLKHDVLPRDDFFCRSQAVFLFCCYLSLQVFLSIIMYNYCLLSFNWQVPILDNYFDRYSALVLLGICLPALPLAILLYRVRAASCAGAYFFKGVYFCYVKPSFMLTGFWLVLFSSPGLYFSWYFLYRMWRKRQLNVATGSASQVTMHFLVRITLTMFTYYVLTFASYIPLLVMSLFDLDEEPPNVYVDPIYLSPFTNPKDMCKDDFTDGTGLTNAAIKYSAHMLCPNFLTFLPAILGIAFFALCGLSTPAMLAYRRVLRNLRRSLTAMARSRRPHRMSPPGGGESSAPGRGRQPQATAASDIESIELSDARQAARGRLQVAPSSRTQAIL